MSLYYASLQKLDKPDIVLEIRIMDTANIKEIPASATFFAGTIAVLILYLMCFHPITTIAMMFI